MSTTSTNREQRSRRFHFGSRASAAMLAPLLIAAAAAPPSPPPAQQASDPPLQTPQPPSAAPVATAERSAPDLYRAVAPSVVMVEAQTDKGLVQGSGVVVAANQVATNAHVVAGAIGFVLVRQGQRVWRAEIETADAANDIALLGVLLRRTERFDLPVATKRKLESLRVGETVYAIGAPRGLQQTLSDGLVSGLPGNERLALVQTTAAISPGSSGGGLFDAHGLLVGITTLYLREAQSLNFAVPSDRVQALQDSLPAVLPAAYTLAPPVSSPPAATAAAEQHAQAADEPELPMPLRGVRAVVVLPAAGGPIATDGGLTAERVGAQVGVRLKRAGIEVYPSFDAARAAGDYAVVLAAELSSMWIEETALYVWTLNLDVMDTTHFADGTRGIVTTWTNATHGYGGSRVVMNQVSRAIDELADSLAIAALKARSQ